MDEIGTTDVSSSRFTGFEMTEVVKVWPLRLIHEHHDPGPMEMYLRSEPDGDATTCVIDTDYEMPGKYRASDTLKGAAHMVAYLDGVTVALMVSALVAILGGVVAWVLVGRRGPIETMFDMQDERPDPAEPAPAER